MTSDKPKDSYTLYIRARTMHIKPTKPKKKNYTNDENKNEADRHAYSARYEQMTYRMTRISSKGELHANILTASYSDIECRCIGIVWMHIVYMRITSHRCASSPGRANEKGRMTYAKQCCDAQLISVLFDPRTVPHR
jgi:hypothetical protein